MMVSLHRHLATVTGEDLVGDHDFLLAPPPVLMTPDVAPVHEVSHWQHRDSKPTHKWLPSNNWEESEGAGRCEQTILETSKLVLLNPVVVIRQVLFRT